MRVLIACLLCAAGSAAALDQELTLEHDGRTRTAIVHLPPQAAADKPLPVVLSFHGGGGNARGHQAYTRMDALADREGFITVYPNGTGRLDDKLLTWNAGTCCGYARDEKVDDVGFVRALVDELARRYGIDRARVYATGLSNGGMMSYRLAAELSDRIAAVAPVAGASALEKFRARRAMPILHIHSIDDPRALYYGGLGPPFPFTSIRVKHAPVEDMIGDWVLFEECQPKAGLLEERTSRGHTARQYAYTGCRDGVEVRLWKLTGVGHVWPGGEQDYFPRLLGPSTTVIDANGEMWKFFRRWELPATRQ